MRSKNFPNEVPKLVPFDNGVSDILRYSNRALINPASEIQQSALREFDVFSIQKKIAADICGIAKMGAEAIKGIKYGSHCASVGTQLAIAADVLKASARIKAVRADASVNLSLMNVGPASVSLLDSFSIVQSSGSGEIIREFCAAFDFQKTMVAKIAASPYEALAFKSVVRDEMMPVLDAAAVAQADVRKHLESLRIASDASLNGITKIESLAVRLNGVRLSELRRVAEAAFEGEDDVTPPETEQVESVLAQLEVEFASPTLPIEEKINRLIELIERQENTQIRNVMLAVAAGLIINLITWICTEIVSQYRVGERHPSPQGIVRDVREILSSERIPVNATTKLRIVARRTIPVKSFACVKSEVIATLQCGQVVHPVRRQKKWMEIEWTEGDTGVSRAGWVFSKHLKKVSRGPKDEVTRKDPYIGSLEKATLQFGAHGVFHPEP